MIRKARQKLKTGLVMGLRVQRLSCLHLCLVLSLCHVSQAILCGCCCTEPAVLYWHANCPRVCLGKADEAVSREGSIKAVCTSSLFCSSLAENGFPFSAEIDKNVAARILLCPWVCGLWMSAVHLGPLR